MSHVEDAYSVENEGGLITNDRFSDDTTTTLMKHRGSKNSTEVIQILLKIGLMHRCPISLVH